MGKTDVTIEVCGMSGDGTIAAGMMLNTAMSAMGFSVLAFDSYPAEIRGFGRCVTRGRFGETKQLALKDSTDILISLDDEQSLSRLPMLKDDAIILFDGNPQGAIEEAKSLPAHVKPSMRLFGVPFRDLASGAAGSARGRNLTALGALAALIGLRPDPFLKAIAKKFKSKGEKVVKANQASFDAGYDYVREKFVDDLMDVGIPKPVEGEPEKVLWSGNTAIAEGALAAGVRNYFGYPITPATPIMEYLAAKLPERGGRVTQMEDEISSIGAVLGSFYAGARAMTATSGPGFALMTELIGHGVMTETPAVIVDAQRGGPSTGLPTKTEQSDLHAAVFGGPGDSPRIVIAPTDVTECYHYTAKAFGLAEKYQTPVIVLTDFFLDNRVENIDQPKADPAYAADVNVYPDPSLKGAYKRFTLTPSGISPRAIPGVEGFLHNVTGLEHTEAGNPVFTGDNHTAMCLKRARKLEGALAELWEPEEFADSGPLDVGVIGWGSTFGSVLDAVTVAREKGQSVGALKVTSIFPFHEAAIRQFMARCREVLIPEMNASGQLANLLGRLFHKDVRRLNLVTAQPLYPSAITNKIEEIIEQITGKARAK